LHAISRCQSKGEVAVAAGAGSGKVWKRAVSV